MFRPLSFLAAFLLVPLGFVVTTTPSVAQTCSVGGTPSPSVQCAIDGGTGAITVNAPGAVNNGAGDGIFTSTTGGSTGAITITTGGNVTGSVHGIQAQQNGLGAVTVNTSASGTVTGGSQESILIEVTNINNTSAITLTTNNIAHGAATEEAIEINNDGRGSTTIVTNGTVTNTGRSGISVDIDNFSNDQDVKITTNGVIDVRRTGIYVRKRGNGGAIIVDANAAVMADDRSGIAVETRDATTVSSFDIDATSTEGLFGTYIVQRGTGAIDLMQTGVATGLNEDGIYIESRNAGVNNTINVNTVGAVTTTTNDGMEIYNRGLGSITLNDTGTISSLGGRGLYVRQTSTAATANVVLNVATVSGVFGITAANSGLGAMTIAATGSVTGTAGEGIIATMSNANATGNLTITTGAVSGTSAIIARNAGTGAVSITTNGDVTSSAASGIFVDQSNTTMASAIAIQINSGTVSGTANGINFDQLAATAAASSVTIAAGATVQGGTGAGFRDSDQTSGSRATTLDIGGTITGGAMGAAQMGRGNDTVILRSTASVTGIVDGGAGTDLLRFEYAGDSAFAASTLSTQYTNFENYEKAGAGVLTLTGADAGTRNFSVLTGSVLVDAMMVGTDFTTSAGTIFGGSGAVNDLTIGGTLDAGTMGIAPLTVGGNLVFNDNSTFTVQVEPGGTSDLINVAGTTLISNVGTTLNIQGAMGMYPNMGAFTVIQGGGAVSGTFANVTDDIPDLDFVVNYNANDVTLAYTEVVVPPGGGSGGGGGAPAVSDKSTTAGASITGTQSTNIYSNTMQRRARTLLPPTEDRFGDSSGEATLGFGFDTAPTTQAGMWSAFAQALGGKLDVGDRGGLSGYELETYGLALGLEVETLIGSGEAIFGVSAGTIVTQADVSNGDVTVNAYQAGLHGAYRDGPFALSGAVSYALLDYDIERFVTTGAGIVVGDGSTDGHAFSAVGEVSYNVAPALGLSRNVALSPFLRGEVHHATADGYTETGIGVLNLTVEDTHGTQGVADVGMRIMGSHVAGDVVVRPEAMVGYRRLFGDLGQSVNSAITFAGANFVSEVAKPAENQVVFGAGLTVEQDKLAASFRYEGAAGDDTLFHTGQGSLTLKF